MDNPIDHAVAVGHSVDVAVRRVVADAVGRVAGWFARSRPGLRIGDRPQPAHPGHHQHPVIADDLAVDLDDIAWERRSAGPGSKSERFCDWAWIHDHTTSPDAGVH